MTNEQKERILTLREKNMTMQAIADELGLSVNTVKSFCRRQKGKPLTTSGDVLLCKCCGKPVQQTPGRKTKLFCSDACRMKWWNSHQDQVNRKALHKCTCAHCGKYFMAYGSRKRKYCSLDCYFAGRFGEEKA